MAAKSSDWRPGPTVCRCCFAEGCYKDISTEYFWMGKREVYAEMLSDTFDICISYSQLSGPNSNSRLICEPCISRLRDASDFKRQVVECEKTFMQLLDPGRIVAEEIEVPLPTLEDKEEVKLERVKEEGASDDDFDDSAAFPDDDDDLDDEPLMKLATKIPKKEAPDDEPLLDLETLKPEKRKSSSKVKASPAKKAKKKQVAPKPSASKHVTPAPEKKKKENIERMMARHNAQLIILKSTAYPFRLPEEAVVCVFCNDAFDDPSVFRQHMEQEHSKFRGKNAFAHLHEGFLKVDCTDLKCRMCSERAPNVRAMVLHLQGMHNEKLDLDYDLGIQEFVIYKDRWICAICNTKFPTLRSLSRHTQTHYVKFTCHACGKSYSTSTSLNHHINYSHCGQTSGACCRKCKKRFANPEERREHMLNSKRCLQHVCNFCGERFYSWLFKQKHMMEQHSQPKKTFPCSECDLVFEKSYAWRIHFKIAHTNNHLQCSCCGKKFDSDYKLKRHMVTHTGEKLFDCPVCEKAFPRKSTLQQHMWIHRAVKKWQCVACNKQFNQSVSLRNHNKTHHPELQLQQELQES